MNTGTVRAVMETSAWMETVRNNGQATPRNVRASTSDFSGYRICTVPDEYLSFFHSALPDHISITSRSEGQTSLDEVSPHQVGHEIAAGRVEIHDDAARLGQDESTINAYLGGSR
jgi:hypothetical protein